MAADSGRRSFRAKRAGMSEADQRLLDHAYGLVAGMALMGAAVVILLLITWRPTC